MLFKSNVYETVDSQSDKIWKYQRYFLSYEYFHKPFLVPPFVLLYHVFYFFKICFKMSKKLCCKDFTPTDNRLDRIFVKMDKIYKPGFYFTPRNIEEENRFIRFESYSAKQLRLRLTKEQKLTADYRVKQNNEKAKAIKRKYEGIVEIRQNVATKLESIEEKLAKILGYLNVKPTLEKDGSVINNVIQISAIKSAKSSIKQVENNRNSKSNSGNNSKSYLVIDYFLKYLQILCYFEILMR